MISLEGKLKVGGVPGDDFGKEYCWQPKDGALGLRNRDNARRFTMQIEQRGHIPQYPQIALDNRLIIHHLTNYYFLATVFDRRFKY